MLPDDLLVLFGYYLGDAVFEVRIRRVLYTDSLQASYYVLAVRQYCPENDCKISLILQLSVHRPFVGLSAKLSTREACQPFNPLESRDNYSATSNNMKLVHWPLMGALLHLVQ